VLPDLQQPERRLLRQPQLRAWLGNCDDCWIPLLGLALAARVATAADVEWLLSERRLAEELHDSRGTVAISASLSCSERGLYELALAAPMNPFQALVVGKESSAV